jgi:CheY-like chemotaxis protein
MVVDDEFSVAALIGELLKSCGCEVVLETESSVALKHFAASPREFDLAILDQRMPGLSGNELAEAMLQLEREFPIIICSASSSEAEKRRAVELGVRAYMEKPLDSVPLLEMVSELLGGKPGEREPLQ